MNAPDSTVETLLVETLPDDDRRLLRQGAVLRYITRALAGVVTDSPEQARRLIGHPMVRGGAHGRAEEQWTIAEPLRRALLSGWDGADAIRSRVAARTTGLEALYARLAAVSTRTPALAEVEQTVKRVLAGGDIPRAHDLIRLLDEWPVSEDLQARRLSGTLSPWLRRHTRALRDREATSTYLRRGFDEQVWALLLAGGDPWMLHLHGPGGRGKTMFVKNVLGRACPSGDIPVARIDFDHVTRLGIATTEPWRLLLALAAQLDPQLGGEPFRYMLDKYRTVESVTEPEALPRVAVTPSTGTGADQLDVDAAEEVPAKFAGHLARAVGAGQVVIALDTVENVLHADSASLYSVLEALSDVHGEVPGLRLLISGRYDITGSRPVTGGGTRERAPGVGARWLGESHRREIGGIEVTVGREMAALEIPGFSEDEARRYLSGPGGVTDPAIIEAIVRRVHDNPMKLALLAEYVSGRTDVTAEMIGSFESVDLFYLVDRVVDRISDGHVQWLLRWGALLPILSREAVERVIWPALRKFAETGRGDDTSRDRLPPPPADVSRWPEPRPEQVNEPGALDRAWETLLDYTAHSSWVSRADTLPDAVVFHPDVRRPLRHLLHGAGHEAYDDIHRRSYEYWRTVAASARGTTRSAALRAVLFHAYQPWQGAEHDGDRDFARLLAEAGDSRDARIAMAGEIVDLAEGADIRGPSAEVRSLSHLELAEAAVHRANRRGTPVNEAGLSYHLGEIGADVAGREAHRVRFLRAVLAEAGGRPDESWVLLASAVEWIKAERGPGPTRTSLELMSDWADGRAPGAGGLAALQQLAELARGRSQEAAAARALARGFLAAERWEDAEESARRGGSADLRAETLIALGRPDAVLGDRETGGLWRARAHLLRYEPARALDAVGHVPADQPARPLVMGQAYVLLGRESEALDLLSRAAAGRDSATAVEAGLLLGRHLARTGNPQTARSHLFRLRTFADPMVSLRAAAMEARLFAGEGALVDARRERDRMATVPASVDVEFAVARLAVRGVSDEGLRELTQALARVQGDGPRLLALDGLAEVANPSWISVPAGHRALRDLSRSGSDGPAALVLAQVELARVIGDRQHAFDLIDLLLVRSDPDDAISRAVQAAVRRIQGGGPVPGADDPPPDAGAVSLRSAGHGRAVQIERPDGVTGTLTVAGAREMVGSVEILEAFGAAMGAGDGRLDLLLRDADVSRWPWEAAPGPQRSVVRRHAGTGVPSTHVHARWVDVSTMGSPHLAQRRLVDAYRLEAGVSVRYGWQDTSADITHLVATPVQRRGLPALRFDDDLVTAETLAQPLSRLEPRLLVLDLTLSASDLDAIEQIMVANEFCWHLVGSARDLDVICGDFSGDPDRLRRLIRHLVGGTTLAGIAADFQDRQLDWRNAVAVSTSDPGRNYLLESRR